MSFPPQKSVRAFLIFNYLIAVFLGVLAAQPAPSPRSDNEIKQAIIKESIANYRGNCPCPYNSDKAGHRCGARSAYSRPGGASPLCFTNDVTQKMIDEYRKRTGNR